MHKKRCRITGCAAVLKIRVPRRTNDSFQKIALIQVKDRIQAGISLSRRYYGFLKLERS